MFAKFTQYLHIAQSLILNTSAAQELEQFARFKIVIQKRAQFFKLSVQIRYNFSIESSRSIESYRVSTTRTVIQADRKVDFINLELTTFMWVSGISRGRLIATAEEITKNDEQSVNKERADIFSSTSLLRPLACKRSERKARASR